MFFCCCFFKDFFYIVTLDTFHILFMLSENISKFYLTLHYFYIWFIPFVFFFLQILPLFNCYFVLSDHEAKRRREGRGKEKSLINHREVEVRGQTGVSRDER